MANVACREQELIRYSSGGHLSVTIRGIRYAEKIADQARDSKFRSRKMAEYAACHFDDELGHRFALLRKLVGGPPGACAYCR